MCRPEILPLDARRTELCGGYNVHLALRASSSQKPALVVPSDVIFDATQGRVWVLTGPNRSGKTTYTVGAGLAHLLAQAGLFVPARSARLSPVDTIFTHFPSSESSKLGMGRLDEEAVRLATIFRQATPYSLILLNEALAGTSSLEALALARDAVRGLRLLGARALYVTHLHDLALLVDEINATTPGDGLVGSLVAEPPPELEDEAGSAPPRSFRIRPGTPGRWSYASQIAEQHGISFDQLARLLHERGIAPS
jgi:DNA mismatch repair ATPase MutS